MMKNTPPYAVCKALLINALHFVAKPVISQFAFFLQLFVLLNVLDLFHDGGFPNIGVDLKIPFGIFVCYLFVLPTIIMPVILRRIYKVAIILLAVIQFVVDLYLVIMYGDTFSTLHVDVLAAIVATNPTEAKEYMSAYLTIERVSLILFVLFFLFTIFYYLNKLQIRITNVAKILVSVIVIVTTIVSIVNYKNLLLGNIYFLLRTEAPDLSEYLHNPVVVSNGETPNYVVLVVGESFAKSHSSLYGYEKNTNPLLDEMVKDSSLYVYENVAAACTKTIQAFKSIMTSYVDEMSDSIKWYECITLIEIMKKNDYKTVWLSNQIRKSYFDNEVSRYAALCDEQVFADERNGVSTYDECLLPITKEYVNNAVSHQFIIINLMGSHLDYSERYPQTRSVFTKEDYAFSHPDLSSASKTTLAEYDNSILYNDSVVYEIMRTFEKDDAVVVYFPDHGQDIFNTSNEYAGHGLNGNAESINWAVDIPLMIYTSPLFKQKHPSLYQRIKNATCASPYRTDSIMYTIMDIAGIDSVNNISYRHKSLIKE